MRGATLDGKHKIDSQASHVTEVLVGSMVVSTNRHVLVWDCRGDNPHPDQNLEGFVPFIADMFMDRVEPFFPRVLGR